MLIVCKFCCICSGSSCCSCRCCNSNSKQLLKHCCSWRCCCCRSLVVRAKWQLFWRLMIITFSLPLHSALALFPPRCRQVRLPPLGRGILSTACEFLNQKHKRPKTSHIFLASICRARDSFASYFLTDFFLVVLQLSVGFSLKCQLKLNSVCMKAYILKVMRASVNKFGDNILQCAYK